MGIRKVHPDTAKIARRYAREELGVQDPKLRAPDTGETFKSARKANFDVNQVRDSVVVADKKGNEYLLMIDLDPAKSRELNAESAILCASGLIPMVGAPVVAMFALKDLAKAGPHVIKAKLAGDPSDPEKRAIFRMGLKHLGLSGLSLATQGAAMGVKAGIDAAEVAGNVAEVASQKETYDAIKTAKYGIKGAEIAAATHDASQSDAGRSGKPLKALVSGLQGIAGVHHHHERKAEDARVVVVQKKNADGTLEKSPDIKPPSRAEGNDQPTGPPPG